MLGVSFDSVADNAAFAAAHGFTFPLLCDVDRRIGLEYKACENSTDAYPRRITYVIGANGRIESAVATRDPGGQAAQLLETLR